MPLILALVGLLADTATSAPNLGDPLTYLASFPLTAAFVAVLIVLVIRPLQKTVMERDKLLETAYAKIDTLNAAALARERELSNFAPQVSAMAGLLGQTGMRLEQAARQPSPDETSAQVLAEVRALADKVSHLKQGGAG